MVIDWLMAGIRPTQAPGLAAKIGWTIGPVELAETLDHAGREMIADAGGKCDFETARAILRLHSMYARAQKIQDGKQALAAQKELNRLLGLSLDRKPVDAGLGKRLLEACGAELKALTNGKK